MWSDGVSWARLTPAVRALLRAGNGLGSRGAQALWSASTLAAGSVLRATARPWASSGHERVVVIAPHPDDEVAGCAGTLMRHREAGDSVCIAVMTDGCRSRALGFDATAMVDQREREARAVARSLGARLCWLGLREGVWSDEDGRAAIARVLADVNPTIVYATSNIDFHPEHRRVARGLAAVLAESDNPLEVRIYAVQVPLTPLLTNMIHDVSDFEIPIGRLIDCYASQTISLMFSLRARRYAACFYRTGRAAEGFCTMPAERYVALHRRPPAKFNPMGIRAWTDPLAVAVGARERLRWRRARPGSQSPAAASRKSVYGG
jgi:LmbE family N-acetylglucosaminyl deacetylase